MKRQYILNVTLKISMNILIVYAHPEPKSFCAALKNKAEEVFASQGHSVKVSDLYALNFKAVGTKNDFKNLAHPDHLNYIMEQKNASETQGFSKDIEEEQAKVKWADLIIFHHPLWWFTVPAILKGWFDRVFAAGFSWDFGKMYSNGLLKGKKAMLTITTGGGADLYKPEGAHGITIENLLHHVHYGAFFFCGIDVLPPFIAYSTFQAGEEGRKKYLEEYEKLLLQIENTEPMLKHSKMLNESVE